MSNTKFDEIMRDNNIILAIVANLSNNSIITIGKKSKLNYGSLVENLFGDIERVRALNDSLKDQILPQAWNQGIVKCLVCKPVDDIVIGLFFHEYRDAVESYRFGKVLNELIKEKWENGLMSI